MTELLESEQRQGIMIEQHVEAELANDPPTTDVVASSVSRHR
ncbi:Copper sensory histidine kinase CpxA [Klebsiella michiganensis]|nr:Copper sensory histidine kinase CpxA [Klebsiella michiganensis]